MKTASVTYVAPIGEPKTLGWGDITFIDGQSIEINEHDNPHLFNKLQKHPFFDFTMGKDEPDTVKPPVKRGRPSNIDKAAAAAAAEEADRLAKEAAAKADEAKATHEAILKEDGGKPKQSIFAPATSSAGQAPPR